MKILTIIISWNEEKIIPYTLKHYETFSDKILLLDNNSDDKTKEIAKKFSKVEIIKFNTNNIFEDDVHSYIKSRLWYKYKNEFDWIIVVDADEFIWHPEILKLFNEYFYNNISNVRTMGYNMISDYFPEYTGNNQIYDLIYNGRHSLEMSKPAIFNSKLINKIEFGGGAHSCVSWGLLEPSYSNDIRLLHYKYLGFEYNKNKNLMYMKRNHRNPDFNSYLLDQDTEFKYQQHIIKRSNLNAKTINVVEETKNKVLGVSSDKWEVIKDISSNFLLKKNTVVEVGVLRGALTEVFSLFFDQVFAVDIWKNGYDDNDGTSFIDMKKTEKEFDMVCKRRDNIIKIKKTSRAASKDFEDKSLDFVYIDACHTYEAVKEDILLWIPKIKKNGYIGGHDYLDNKNSHIYGVKLAVDEILGKPDKIFLDHSWVKKL